MGEGGGFDFGNCGGDFGEFAGEVVSAAGVETDFVAVFNGLQAVAVEFYFVLPFGALGEGADEFGEHGRDEGGHCEFAIADLRFAIVFKTD